MSARRILVRLAAFFAAYVAAVSLVLLLKPAPLVHYYQPAPPRPFKLSEDLDKEIELVSLDRESGRSYTRLQLWHTGYAPAPEQLTVRTYFFTSDDRAHRVWSGEPVTLSRPFDSKGYASLTVAAECDWCADADAPRGGYFARVQIAAGSEESELPAGERFFDITTAVPVIVHVERDAARPTARD